MAETTTKIALNKGPLKNLKIDRSKICFITTYPFCIDSYKTDVKKYEDFRVQFDDVADLYTIELCPFKTSKLKYLPNVYNYFCGNNFYIQTKAINEFIVDNKIGKRYEYFCWIDGRVRFTEQYWLTRIVSTVEQDKIYQGFKTVDIGNKKIFDGAAYLYTKQNYNLQNIMFLNGVYGYMMIYPNKFTDILFPDFIGLMNYDFPIYQGLIDQIHHRDILRVFNNYYIEELALWTKKLRDNKWTERLDFVDQQIALDGFSGIQADSECWRMHEHTLNPKTDFLLNKFNKKIPVHSVHDYRHHTK
jgi:hypothetical protein